MTVATESWDVGVSPRIGSRSLENTNPKRETGKWRAMRLALVHSLALRVVLRAPDAPRPRSDAPSENCLASRAKKGPGWRRGRPAGPLNREKLVPPVLG